MFSPSLLSLEAFATALATGTCGLVPQDQKRVMVPSVLVLDMVFTPWNVLMAVPWMENGPEDS